LRGGGLSGFEFGEAAVDVELVVDGLDLLAQRVELDFDGLELDVHDFLDGVEAGGDGARSGARKS
jgi:hypothetical protein